MPVVDDNSLVAQYIRAIENPDSIGFNNGRWEASVNNAHDSNNRGFGVDVMYNNKAHTLTNNRRGRWLSEAEERAIRNEHIEDNTKTLEKYLPSMLLRQYPSEAKQAMALGMLYRGDGIGSILHTPDIKEAYLSGTDKDMQKAVSNFYEKKIPSRAENHNKFFNKRNKTSIAPPMIARQKWSPKSFADYQYKFKNKFEKGGYMNSNSWDSLSMKDKAEMMKVAVNNGMTSLSDIKEAYNKYAEDNEYAEGGPLKQWTLKDEAGYNRWRNNLPANLRNTKDDDYDMRAAYKSGMQSQWNDKDKSYHLGSRDPNTGRILKSPHHPTYLEAIATDAELGYHPIIDSKGNTYTETWKGNENVQNMINPEIEVPYRINNEYADGGNLFANGGYSPSAKLKKDIATWEGSSMQTNRSFEAEAKDFNRVIPTGIRNKLSNTQLDALYSYGYNVGMGNLKKRVLPVLELYSQGKASNEDVQKAMWASKDSQLRGLTKRRNWEREMFGGNYKSVYTGKPTNYQVPQSVWDDINTNLQIPQGLKTDNAVDPALSYTPPVIDMTLFKKPVIKAETPVYDPNEDRRERLNTFNTVMGLMEAENPLGGYTGLMTGGKSGLMSVVQGIYDR